MATELKVPEVGESISEVFLGPWLKQVGDHVTADESLVEVETDKATLEIPSPITGVISEILKQEGETAQVGDVIAILKEATDQPAETTEDENVADAFIFDTFEQEPEASGDSQAAMPSQETSDGPSSEDHHVMPAAARALAEQGLSADEVEASGPGGRLLKEDVLRHQASQTEATPSENEGLDEELLDIPDEQAAASPAPAAQPAPAQPQAKQSTQEQEPKTPASQSPGREEETVAMSPLRRRIAERLVEAQATAAILTTFNEIDMSAVMALRNDYKDMFADKYGIKLGFMSFFVKAVIDALAQYPAINAKIVGSDIVYHNYFDIGVAVSSKKGLIVPVIRNAEKLSFAGVELAIKDFIERSQTNKISPAELQGGTFTISNGGVFGSLMSTPILNPPQSGVLGMHAIQERPVAIKGEVVIRPMMYVALSYDHRIVDGREAVSFLKRIKEAVEAPSRILLEV